MNQTILMIFLVFIELLIIGYVMSLTYDTKYKIPDTQLGYCLIISFVFIVLYKYSPFDIGFFTGILYFILLFVFYKIPIKEVFFYTLIFSISRNLIFSILSYLSIPVTFQLMLTEGVFFISVIWISWYFLTLHLSWIICTMLILLYAMSSYTVLVDEALALMIVLFCFFMLFLALIKYVNELYEDSMKLKTIEHTLSKQKQYMGKQKQEMDNFHKQKHDILERLEILHLLANHKEYDALQQQLQDMTNQIAAIHLEEYTTMIAIDSVLSYYRETYPQISFDFDCDHFISLFLPDYDVSTLCINVLKNAVEASYPYHKSKISFIMKQRYHQLYISCENDYQSDYKKKGHEGWGLSILEDITQRNHGKYQIHKDSNHFQIEFFFPIGE